jgi:hypothetical protein
MKFVTYFSSSGNSNQDSEKFLLLRYFTQGVARIDDVLEQHAPIYTESDVALIQGWCTDPSNTSIHNVVRKSVIEGQLARNRYVVSADSNLFLYAVGKQNTPYHYLRYSINGVFPSTGIYCDTTPDPARWQKISLALGIKPAAYRKTGSDILLLLQRNGGWSMAGLSVQDWLVATLTEIRKHSDRRVVIRAHPGDQGHRGYLDLTQLRSRMPEIKNYTLSQNSSLVEDLGSAWAAVNHNSSAVVGAALEGIPVFVTDPARSQCADIALSDLSKIEYPVYPDRDGWLHRISQFHWRFSELRSGECWRHMRKFINRAQGKIPAKTPKI